MANDRKQQRRSSGVLCRASRVQETCRSVDMQPRQALPHPAWNERIVALAGIFQFPLVGAILTLINRMRVCIKTHGLQLAALSEGVLQHMWLMKFKVLPLVLLGLLICSWPLVAAAQAPGY